MKLLSQAITAMRLWLVITSGEYLEVIWRTYFGAVALILIRIRAEFK